MKHELGRISGWAAMFLIASSAVGTQAAAKPNIVHIVADDLGWKDVGFNGCVDIKTPVEQILPRIQAARPEVRLWVVGKDPAREIQALGNRSDIIVTGTVEDLRPYLQQAAVAMSPVIYGAGIQNKVLEAMACGTPVVSTPQAVSALNTKAGEDVLIGQDLG